MPISRNFPQRTLKSEKFQIDPCQQPSKKWSFWAGCWIPALVAISFKNKPGIICSGQIWFFKPKSAIGKWSSKEMWMKQHKKNMLDTFQVLPWNGAKYRETDKTTISENDVRYILEWFFGKFVHYLLPPSEVISSFLFPRNTFQVLGRHSKWSKCDVWRVPHHGETGKTWQNKWFKRKIISVQKLSETLIFR